VRRTVILVALALIAAPVAACAASAAAPAAPAANSAQNAPPAPAAAPGSAAAPAPDKPPAPPRKPPPYEAQLLRLAQMVGALAYLRDVCGAGDGETFRAKLATLIQAEGVGDETRDFVAGAYNEAYRSYAASYRTCTPAAKEIIAHFLKETDRLASDIAARFGGG
jgi:uncharacterized protein (TIGR02301 family)